MNKKSAPTEVGAPKNANSDCCHTNLNKIDKGNPDYSTKWNLRFYQIQKSRITKKEYNIPKEKYPYLFSIKFVWQVHFNTIINKLQEFY